MKKKTYKDLKKGDTVYFVDDVTFIETKIKKFKIVDFYGKDHYCFECNGINYQWCNSVESFKDATSAYDVIWDMCIFFNRKEALKYFKKNVRKKIKVQEKKLANEQKYFDNLKKLLKLK